MLVCWVSFCTAISAFNVLNMTIVYMLYYSFFLKYYYKKDKNPNELALCMTGTAKITKIGNAKFWQRYGAIRILIHC